MAYMRKARLLSFCRADRDELLAAAYARVAPAQPAPAELLDDIIEEGLELQLVPDVLPRHILGYCDFDGRRIVVNTRIAQISMPRTKVEGVIASTKAHEIAHVRFPDHEREVRAENDQMTLPMFEPMPPTTITCYRDLDAPTARLSAAARRREYQAEFYASVFLVPETQLLARDEAQRIERAWRSQEPLSSRYLWSLVLRLADHFHVTGTLMAFRLVDLGWLSKRERELSIVEHEWLPFAPETP